MADSDSTASTSTTAGEPARTRKKEEIAAVVLSLVIGLPILLYATNFMGIAGWIDDWRGKGSEIVAKVTDEDSAAAALAAQEKADREAARAEAARQAEADRLLAEQREADERARRKAAEEQRRIAEAQRREQARLKAIADAKAADQAEFDRLMSRTSLLTGSEEDLTRSARKLVTALGKLDGSTAITDAYAKFPKKYDATRIGVIKFRTGVSTISEEDITSLETGIAAGNDDSFYLVVGYSDTTGSADANKALSRERAESVANSVADLANNRNRVQAHYFGQTARFGEDNKENRIAEVWRLER